MKRERPPWDRFARWLRRQPMNRVVGCVNTHNRPIANFLGDRGVFVPTVEGGWMYVFHPQNYRFGFGKPLPEWAASFEHRLDCLPNKPYMADFTVSDCLAILREMGRERMLAKRGIPERRAA